MDTEAHRPKDLVTPGSGWEMLLQFGNTLLQDRVLFASNCASYFQPSDDLLTRVFAGVLMPHERCKHPACWTGTGEPSILIRVG
jgi:hypothetical protein